MPELRPPSEETASTKVSHVVVEPCGVSLRRNETDEAVSRVVIIIGRSFDKLSVGFLHPRFDIIGGCGVRGVHEDEPKVPPRMDQSVGVDVVTMTGIHHRMRVRTGI